MAQSDNDLEYLRVEAERILDGNSKWMPPPKGEGLRAVLHELSLREIELEIENRHLRADRSETEREWAEYSALYHHSPMAYLTFDKSGIVTETNAAAEALLGIDRGALMDKPLSMHLHSLSRKRFGDHIREVCNGDIRKTCDLNLKNRQARVSAVRIESVRFASDRGELVRSILTDVTTVREAEEQHRKVNEELEKKVAERTAELRRANEVLQKEIEERTRAEEEVKRAVAELDRNRALLQAIIDSLPVGLWIADSEGKMVLVNDIAYTIWAGKAPRASMFEEPAQRNAWWADTGKLISVDDRPLDRAMRGETCWEMAVDFERLDGTRGTQLASAAPVRNSEGTILGSVVVAQDITERRQMEEELRRSRDELERRVQERTAELARERQFLRAVIDNIPVMLAVYTRKGEVTLVNKEVERLLGRSREDLARADPPADVFSDSDYRREVWEFMVDPQPGWKDVKMRASDGRLLETRWTNVTLSEDSRVGIGLDMTERNRLESQLRQAHKMEAVGTLAGGIAHDFNNILAIIIGNTELAMDKITSRKDARDSRSSAYDNLEHVLLASRRARDLIRQVLAFSRKRVSRPRPIRLAPLVAETCRMLRATLPATIDLKVDVKTRSDAILADEASVQQVIVNLATNAADAMREEGGELRIGVSRATTKAMTADGKAGRFVKLTVSDTGCGMSPEVQHRIFEPFFTTKESGKGTGMGLAVVYGIVDGYGGIIRVESETGKGSVFTVFFPEAGAVREKHEQEERTPGARARVLFVDDEPALVSMAQTTLEDLGYAVTALASSTEAWRLFAEAPDSFDLVITDYTMPGLTGDALAKRITGARPDIPVIMCTGYSQPVSPEEAREAGIRLLLMKPLTRTEMVEAITRVLAPETRKID